MMADLIAAGFHVGCAWTVSAAVPAVWGVAIDVPEAVRLPVPVPMPTDTMLTPGAATSGLRWESGRRGPPEVNEARPVWIGGPALRPMDRPSRWTRAKPSEVDVVARPRTPTNGMVTTYGSPVSGFMVIGPSNGGRLVALLIITTAAAPAFWPKMARATRAHVPRCTITSLPATFWSM